MKFRIKIIIIFFVLFLPIFLNSMAGGEELILDLKGKWNGTAFLYADPKGFSYVISKVISLDITKQSGLNFSGDIEIKEKGSTRKFGFSGFIDKKRRYLCLITQGGDINMGYLITKNIMKVHLRSIGRPSEITVYRLIKDKRPSFQRENLSKGKIFSSRDVLFTHRIFGWLPEEL
ncbi:MAG: hypothetical protein ABFD50_10595 [Smithella sp.]